MALKDDLRPASFRGVPFAVVDAGLAAGRRVEVHTYPKRDKPWVEDLGRATREIDITAVVVGSDYVARANALLAAFEQPGPGTLVHPWLGTMQVSLKDLARVYFDAGLGQARINLSVVESGELTFPAAVASTAAQSRLAAASLEDAAVTEFASTYTMDGGGQDFVLGDAQDAINSGFDEVKGDFSPAMALGYADNVASARSGSLALISQPTALGKNIMDFLRIASRAEKTQDWMATTTALVRLAKSSGFAVPPFLDTTPSRRQSSRNAAAVNGLWRQGLLAQAVGASSLTDATVYDDSIALRKTLTTALDGESRRAGDTVYQALQVSRRAVYTDLTARSKDSARLTTINTSSGVPNLVTAYKLYQDAMRVTEISSRNKNKNPLFAGMAILKILTR